MTPILEAKKISKSYLTPTPFTLLSEISLTVDAGVTIAISGRSGEGKSTLLHIFGTLDEPTSGRIFIKGEDVAQNSFSTIRNRSIGFIFQAFHLLEEETVLDNVLLPAKIARVPTHKKSASYARALELLELCNLKSRAHHLAKLLSGGEKQRTAIARALINDPDLLLADEPTGNLDKEHSKQIHDLLISSAKNHKKALIIVTHDLELAALCDHKYQLSEGKLS